MLYRKYRFYNEGIEIMLPSHLHRTAEDSDFQNGFASENGRVVINITRGGGALTKERLAARMNEYYKGFVRDVHGFDCHRINKRSFLDDDFGELRYSSRMMGYKFYNVFVLGVYENRELIVTMQCMEQEARENECIFDNIAESIRILKRGKELEVEEYACED